VKTIRRAIATYGESPAADVDIPRGNDAISPALGGLGDTDRFSHPQHEVQP
jgi:hypothetical protein